MSESPCPAEAGELQAAILRAARAQALLETELLREAFERVEGDYTAAWKTWPAADTAGRERLWQAVNVLGKVRDHLARLVRRQQARAARIERLGAQRAMSGG